MWGRSPQARVSSRAGEEGGLLAVAELPEPRGPPPPPTKGLSVGPARDNSCPRGLAVGLFGKPRGAWR